MLCAAARALGRGRPIARECGTEPAAYLSENPVMSAEDETVYLTYSTTTRGLEFMMGYYGFVDRARSAATEGIRPRRGCTATTSTTTRTRTVNESQSVPDPRRGPAR